MPRPRKITEPEVPVPPGPDVLEIRFNGRIIHMQRVHGVPPIEVFDDRFVVTGIMKLPVEAPAVEAVVEPSEPVTDIEDVNPA